ncbi:homeobox protein vent1-like [Erpetoichthys calabaricus]|uniref:homeobox protein vent1-like n=1 Tax=Erpetoichthys calabaricus TaxID=27687 RepID=UPI0010A04256|nr:homeobox protein vent1-like [Erpetoichthys calabaricus]
MSKSYTVEWLSQSHTVASLSEKSDLDKEQGTGIYFKPHIPCMVQPRPPTSFCKASVQLKSNLNSKHLLQDTDDKRINWPVGSPAEESMTRSSSVDSKADSSDCESESAQSDYQSPYNEDIKEDGCTQRKLRTKFTYEQIHKLEKTFSSHKYLGASERIKIAAKLNLSETQIKTWFQNRRMKLKREAQDNCPDYFYRSPVAHQIVYPAVASMQHFSFPQQHIFHPSYPAVEHPSTLHFHPWFPQHLSLPPMTAVQSKLGLHMTSPYF